MGEHAVARHQVGNDVLAEIVARFRRQGVALQLLVQELRVEHVDAHARQRRAGLARESPSDWRRFLDELAHAQFVVHAHDAEGLRLLHRHFDAGDGQVGLRGSTWSASIRP